MKLGVIWALPVMLVISSCYGSNSNFNSNHAITNTVMDSSAENIRTLEDAGWVAKTPETGELSNAFGTTNKYGTQNNYFDIIVGTGFDVAIKIVDCESGNCIRYVFVPEQSKFSVQDIPQGTYYLKLAYGKNWMELNNGINTIGKFYKNPFYERSKEVYDFGRKNSNEFINYQLSINVVGDSTNNNFSTVKITEEEFLE